MFKMKRIILIASSAILIGVLVLLYKISSGINELEETFNSEHNLKDSSLVVIKSQLSPNAMFQFFEYKFDNGGFGYSRVFWSVVKNDSTIDELENGLLPDGYKAIEWTNDYELIIKKWEPYYSKGKEPKMTLNSTINEVKLIVK